MFSRIAIVNRGEAAMRLIHAVRDLSAQTGERIETVALYSNVDRNAAFVREADLAYPLGPAPAQPYLDLAVLETALVDTGADAAWAGWGFVAEDPAFAELCEKIGVTFIGPSADAMRKLGDKVGAKRIAEEAGLPVACERTSQEALRALGSGVAFPERLVTGARHVDVQVIADGQGTAWALGIRDCSVQRRNQKVIEESPSPVLSPTQNAELREAAERLALAVGYAGAATVEFLYHPGEKLFAFLKVNTGIQAGHPVTELTTGTDLVRLQLHVAAGGRLEGVRPAEAGHAVQARLNAEDPDRDFAPSPGRIERLVLPAGPGVRVDAGVSEGDTIPAGFDSVIAKIIAYGPDRDTALARLRRAMRETTAVVEGGATNKSFVLDLLDQPEVTGAGADIGWIDRARASGRLDTSKHSAIALAAAAIEAYEDEEGAARHRLLSTARGGHPQVRFESGRPLDMKLRGASYRVSVARVGFGRYHVDINGTQADVERERHDSHSGQLTVNGQRYRLVAGTHGPVHLVEVDGVTHRVSRDEGEIVRSPAPALVVATLAAVGDEVVSGAPILVLESMKMETVLRAPFHARVRSLQVSVGSQVGSGAALLRLKPLSGNAPESAGEAVDIDLPAAPEAGAAVRAGRGMEDLRGLLLGFDADADQAIKEYMTARAETGEARCVQAEIGLLTVFADLCELTRSSPAGEDLKPDSPVHSARECFHTYLQSLDVDRAGLPEIFQGWLRRTLRHYGVTSLERGPELEEAVFRIFLAQQRASANIAIVSALLREWIAEAPPAGTLREEAGLALEHLIAATQVRYPSVSDLARGVVFRWFAQPLLRRARASVYAGVRASLRHLDQHPSAPDRAERIAAMVAGSEPLVRLLGQRIGRPGTDPAPLLEVLTRRYYGNEALSGTQARDVNGCTFVVASHVGTARVVATAVDVAQLSDAVRAVGDLAAPAGMNVRADLYIRWPDPPEPDAMAARMAELIAAHELPDSVTRITATVTGSGGAVMHQQLTFRRRQHGFSEDRLIRGLHPRVAERMQLQRLREFDLTRLPSADEEVYLFKAVAKTSPADERLIALAQVRDLTPLREADGRLVALPAAENTFAACLDAIRTVQAQRPANKRFDTNRIVIYVWPPSDLTRAELAHLAQRVQPTTYGAGLEEVLFLTRRRHPVTGELSELAVTFHGDVGHSVRVSVGPPGTEPVQPVDDYRQKVLRAARRGTVYPYELTAMLGDFTEYDLSPAGDLVPVDRPKGKNEAAIVAGVVRTPTKLVPEGVQRVILLGDPTKSLGALSEPECARVIAALGLASSMGVPLEWFALSSGARISMESGTENMDWVAAALKRIVEFTQAGGEINIVIAGITVGAQPYWNAEATMLMHTKGILVMTPASAMLLTGAHSLDFSGGVSAEDNFGIGGYDRVMGPNGQAQYWAPDLAGARDILMAHYDHTYVVPGEAAPRRAVTTDPASRDISDFPHDVPGSDFTTVGQIFSASHNPDRKKPFDIRTVMRALSDQDHPVLERWADMADAGTAVVQDVRIGGRSVCLLGIESRPVPRRGFPPTDGPDTYTAGTLFPRSSKKAARAINATSGNRPLVVLANLSGFDGSPESMRALQLEYGAEIGRAIVNFEGPIVFCVISRYHGGAFVVFSKALNPNITVLALEGSFASVLGGAPAAAVVFAGDVSTQTANDPRVATLRARLAEVAGGADRAALTGQLAETQAAVRAEKISEIAAEFDRVHSIQRAVEVGSVDAIITASQLRPRVIAALAASGPPVDKVLSMQRPGKFR